MDCPNCQTHNPDNARYCGGCGTILEVGGGGPHSRQEQTSSRPQGPDEPYLPAEGLTHKLKPRSLGELVRETLAVYRANFWVMVWLALFANIPLFIALFPFSPAMRSAITLGGLFTGLLADAAAVYAVSRWYIGRKTNVATCGLVALNSAPSLLLAGLLFFSAVLAGLALSLLLIGIPLLVFVVVVWFFYVQAIMVEGKLPVDALRRSFELVQGTWLRVFGIGVAFALLLFLVAAFASLPGIVVGLKYRLLGDLMVTLGGVLVTPLAYIAATVVYFDLRVRKEGYNLETLASELGFSQDSPAQGPATPRQ